MFQKFYSKMLAKRLVNMASASDDAESSMISKLKVGFVGSVDALILIVEVCFSSHVSGDVWLRIYVQAPAYVQ